MRKFAMCAMFLGLMGLGAGCQKSPEAERQDVREAQQDAAENIADEQKDVQEAQREGAEEVRDEQRDVTDAQREGQQKVIEEQREAADAARENRDNTVSPTTPGVPPTTP